MKNENFIEIDGQEAKFESLLDQELTPTSGYKTSQGQMTAVFIIVSMVFSYFGYSSWTPEKLETAWQAIAGLLAIILPLLGSIPVLTNYINSRGKIASNSITHKAAVMASADGSWFKNIGKIIEVAETGVSTAKEIKGTIRGKKIYSFDADGNIFDDFDGKIVGQFTYNPRGNGEGKITLD